MEIDSAEIIGLIAATLTTSAFVPQVVKTWKTKNVEGLSLTMYSVFFVGIVLWLVYGIMVGSLSVIVANIVTAILAFVLVYFKLTFKSKK
ncbi:MAG: SemiSWEET transporter [Flavobacteriaceae bacterium]